jgi:hypothetical protein
VKKSTSTLTGLFLCFCVIATTVSGRTAHRATNFAVDLEFGQMILFGATELAFTVINHGPTIPADTISVRIIAKKKDNSPAYYYTTPITQVLPADQTTKVSIQLPADKNLTNLLYYVLIDSTDRIVESQEDNNMSLVQNGPAEYDFPSGPPAQHDFPTGIDLKFRPAVYFTPPIHGAKEKMGTPSVNLHIKNSELGQPSNGGYLVLLKVFVMRTSGAGKMVPNIRSTNKTTGDVNNGGAILFDGDLSATFNIAVNVAFGENKIMFELDTGNKYSELHEDNNKLEVTVIVDQN